MTVVRNAAARLIKTIAPTSKNSHESTLDDNPNGLHLCASHIRHVYFRAGKANNALDDVTLDIPPGQFVSLVGPSGCGKTTLLNMFAGLVTPSEGTILFNEVPRLAAPGEISYMLATDALLPWASASQNVQLGLQVRGIEKRLSKTLSDAWLTRLGLDKYKNESVQHLSHGMRQRVAIARTLVQNPKAILMDEPFAALDAQTRTLVQAEFLDIWEKSKQTTVLVTHDLPEAILLADRVVLLGRSPGKIVCDMTIDLPRPRQIERDRASDEFVSKHNEIWQLLRGQFDEF